MKKRADIAKRVVAAAVAFAVAACSQYRIIPDDTLADIFHDAFVANAYVENRHLAIDSLDLYSPIFEKYGYTVDDVRYTIGNFSKRKNARLGDVVEITIKKLEQEGLALEREAAVLDTIDNIARRTFRRTLHSDSLLRVERLQDTGKLHLSFNDIRPGEYKVEFDYRVDSLDDAINRKTVLELKRGDSTTYNRVQQTLYRNFRTEHVSRQIVADTSAHRLDIMLMEFSRPKPPGRFNRFGITITDLKVTYTPETGSALDSLYERQLPVRIFFDDFFNTEN